MTAIKFWGYTYRDTAEGDHGVFTDNSGGAVSYAGKIAGDSVRVGVATYTSGSTAFVECDANGKEHGRRLVCTAGGDTWYYRCEHGRTKEQAVLYANGTCEYDGEACRADYAPFVALQAKGLAIKARPALGLPTAASMPHFLPGHRPPVGPIGHCFCTRRNWRRPTPTGCALADSTIGLRGPCGTATAKQMHHASNLDDAPGGRMHHACAPTACVVHPSAVCARAANPHAPPLFPSRAARPRGASHSAAGCTCRLCTPRAARTPPRLAYAFRTAHLHSGLIARTR
jgi:hypothetical protein